MTLVSKFMVYRALSDKTYLSLGLLSPLTKRKAAEKLLHKLKLTQGLVQLIMTTRRSGTTVQSYIKHHFNEINICR